MTSGVARVMTYGGSVPHQTDTLELIVHPSGDGRSVSATLFRALWRPNLGIKRVALTPPGAPPGLVPPRPGGVREEAWFVYWASVGLFLKVEKQAIHEVAAEQLALWSSDHPLP